MNSNARLLLGTPAMILACLAVITQAMSLTVENISLERMSSESHMIVYGTVLSSYSQWEDKNIYTYTTIRVKESLKGEHNGTVTVKQLGGAVGDTRQDINGTPYLRSHEDVVLFLVHWKGHNWIHSIVLGKFSVIIEDNRAVAFNDLNNIGLIDPVTRQEITRPGMKLNHIPLQNFLNEVRSFTAK